jgi:hypothetical protein
MQHINSRKLSTPAPLAVGSGVSVISTIAPSPIRPQGPRFSWSGFRPRSPRSPKSTGGSFYVDPVAAGPATLSLGLRAIGYRADVIGN